MNPTSCLNCFRVFPEPSSLPNGHSALLPPSKPVGREEGPLMMNFKKSLGYMKEKRRSKRGSNHDKGKGKATLASLAKRLVPTEPPQPLKLDILVESPPVVFLGTSENSTGAIFSARLNVIVPEPRVTLQRLQVKLTGRASFTKPVIKECRECAAKERDFKVWELLSRPIAFGRGTHSFPFTYMIPGRLPATTRAKLGRIEYTLFARATTDQSDTVDYEKELLFQRALGENPTETHTGRIKLAPTWNNIAIEFICPQMIYPIGETFVKLRLIGVVQLNDRVDRTGRNGVMWNLHRLEWRIEERQFVVSAACTEHSIILGGQGKGLYYENIRTIGSGQYRRGWKTDFNVLGNDVGSDPREDIGGSVEMEFPIVIDPTLDPCCDVKAPTGLTVQHFVVIEGLIQSFEGPLNGKGPNKRRGDKQSIRDEFPVIVTERSGMGISWDDEKLPGYSESLQSQPPAYSRP